jgi:hypothetical protein
MAVVPTAAGGRRRFAMLPHDPQREHDLIRAELTALREEVVTLREQVTQLARPRPTAAGTGTTDDEIRFGPPERAGPRPVPAARIDRRYVIGALAATSIGGLFLTGVGRPGERAAAATATGRVMDVDISKPDDARTAVHACTSGVGNAVVGECQNIDGTGSGVVGVSHGSGHALLGFKPPGAPGEAVVGIGAGDAGVLGSSASSTGVVGTSALGRGGSFSGARAQVRLSPSERPTHPDAGLAGDLFLDRFRRLWLCRGTTEWTRLA